MSIAERVTDHLHPQLAALKADPSGESAFWERMEAERTPLIEPVEGESGWRWDANRWRALPALKQIEAHLQSYRGRAR